LLVYTKAASFRDKIYIFKTDASHAEANDALTALLNALSDDFRSPKCECGSKNVQVMLLIRY